MNILHLLSGGVDSVTLLADLRKQKGNSVKCLCFNYRQRHEQELLWARHHAAKFGTSLTNISLPELGGLTEQSWVVPNRNSIFLAVAVNLACRDEFGCSAVSIAVNKDDSLMFPDCRPGFFEAQNALNKAAGYSVKILTPYINYTKAMIVQRAEQLGVNLGETWSCYQPTATGPCGKCPACKKMEEVCGV